MENIYDFFYPYTEKYSVKEIAKAVGVNRGTVDRWLEKKEVPSYYYFDLCRMDGIEIDYSKFSKKEKDQFYTSEETAQYCIDKVYEVLKEWNVDITQYHFIEPSAGNGSFYNLLPTNKRTGVDIEPQGKGIQASDFLLWKPRTIKNICIGNPPFGLRGHLALKFVNHAAKFSDFVCFIVPQLFVSNGRGSCRGRVEGLNLIHSEIVDSTFYYPDGRSVKVNVIFQIWSKHYKVQETKTDLKGIIKLYSLSDGGTPDSTRNKKYIDGCDYYLPTSCFGKDKMKLYNSFTELQTYSGREGGYGIIILSNLIFSNMSLIKSIIEKINWSEVSFISTNGAYNLNFELIEKSIGKRLDKYIKLQE